MYKYQKISTLKKVMHISFFILSIVAVFLTSSAIHAQSTEDISFGIKTDKSSIIPGDTFNVIYTIINNSTLNPIYNVNADFKYLNSLQGISYTGSSTGLSQNDIKNKGYSLGQINPKQTITITINYKSETTLTPGQKIFNTLDNTNKITSTLTFNFSKDSNSPIITKDATLDLPDIAAPKPDISKIKYPQGITGFDLSTLDITNFNSVKGFYLQGLHKITFQEPLDLSSPEALNILSNFTKYFDLNSPSSIGLIQNNVFNKKATIELHNLTMIDTPVIFLEKDKTDTLVTYDNDKETATFDIDKLGRYTALGEIKTTIPSAITSKYLEINGTITDPTAKAEFISPDNKSTVISADINTGKFTFNYTFDGYGSQDFKLNVYGKTNLVNTQSYTIDVDANIITTTPTPKPVVIPKDQDYFKAFLYILIGILAIGIISVAAITWYSLRKKKRDKLNNLEDLNNLKNSDIDNANEDLPLEITNFAKQKPVLDDTSSDDRHEIIRHKVEEKLNNSDKTDDISKDE